MNKNGIYVIAMLALYAIPINAAKSVKEVHQTVKEHHSTKIQEHLAKAKQEQGSNFDAKLEEWVNAFDEAYDAWLEWREAILDERENKDDKNAQEKVISTKKNFDEKTIKSDQLAANLLKGKNEHERKDLLKRIIEFEKDELNELKKHPEQEFERDIEFQEQGVQALETKGLQAIFFDKSKYPAEVPATQPEPTQKVTPKQPAAARKK